ncbi:lysophospholipid acyltransferase family protein [Blattabacterium cuenoti]|uniref:lysophospholipid acyltransferase family protein n=1 Tax=Blattabacterium cuenoti TaxID=1653831 RepID=UPI00163BE4C7|nr:lysophospholipid acyltransferase family protein [Blattabacterium cuenoti]
MKFIKLPFILLWRIWFFIINIFLIPLWAGASIPFLFNEKYYHIAYWFHQMWARSNLLLMGFWYILDKEKEILDNNKQYMIISNHTSIIDIMLIFSIMRNHPLVFVGKSELSKIPIFGFVYRKSNILIERDNISSCVNVFKQIQKKINCGKSICIFPEGGVLNKKHSIYLNPFKKGAFFVAILNKLPIVPFTIADIKTKFPSFFVIKGAPGKIRIKQHHSISTRNLSLKDKNFLKKKCFDIIKNQLKVFYEKKYVN